jgi:cytoskeletal protein CcmA (bactofilin family)
MGTAPSDHSGASAPTGTLVSGTSANIGPGIRIVGIVYSEDDLNINGSVEGEVEVKTTLAIGPQATVRASLHAGDIIVSGNVDGDIRANRRLEIRSTGKVLGNVSASRIVIEDGGYLKGRVDLSQTGVVPGVSANATPQPVPQPQ